MAKMITLKAAALFSAKAILCLYMITAAGVLFLVLLAIAVPLLLV